VRRGALLTAIVLAAACALAARVGAAPASHTLVLYSVAEQEQYVNNSDSRTLGVGNNPFGNFRDVAPVTSKKSHGPFPGDEALFSFNLYSDAGLTKRAGAATFTCQYNFAKNAFCDTSYRMPNGDALIATGGFNFNATKFSLSVTGGSGKYENASGIVEESPSGSHAQRLVFVLDSSGRTAAKGAKHLTFYSVERKESFINNTDDLARGQGHNPFGNYPISSGSVPRNEKAFGPFAGDEANYGFDLYSDAAHKHKAGTAIFVCQYDFGENSFCDAAFTTSAGTLVTKGISNFNSKTFRLSVLGGTEGYRTMRGTAEVSALGLATQKQPVKRLAPMLQQQKLEFTIHPTTGHGRTTLYTSPQHETFVGNIDDETRGAISNPFGNHPSGAPKRGDQGPFPGDEVLFSFAVATDQKLASKTGQAVYTCWYHFAKHAYCDVFVKLADGSTLLSAGSIDFDAKSFTLAVTGGSGRYKDATGEVVTSSGGKHVQKLAYRLG
jgi:hypothetical protein